MSWISKLITTLRPGHPRATEWLSRPSKVEITEAASGDALDSEEQNNIAVYKNNIPAVVNITSKAMTLDFFYGEVPQEGQGSGFVIDKDGHIVTNYHVIADAQQVEVTLHNRKKYRATIVGTDPAHDLAVIQIKAPDLTPSVLGDEAGLIMVTPRTFTPSQKTGLMFQNGEFLIVTPSINRLVHSYGWMNGGRMNPVLRGP